MGKKDLEMATVFCSDGWLASDDFQRVDQNGDAKECHLMINLTQIKEIVYSPQENDCQIFFCIESSLVNQGDPSAQRGLYYLNFTNARLAKEHFDQIKRQLMPTYYRELTMDIDALDSYEDL
jgi:hypothetical protein